MATTRLQDDLLREFREAKRMIQSQINEFEPLAVSLRKPAAQRLAAKGLILTGEALCWLAFLGSIALCIFLNKLYPSYLLFEIRQPRYANLGLQNIQFLQWMVYGIIGLNGLTFLLLARSLARIRQKNAILHMAGARIKTLVGQHLQRKAAIDAIEQRHFNELPGYDSTNINEIPNPGYEVNEGIVHLDI